MTIISSVESIILLPLMGLTSGAQPIISYNYGAQQFDRVKKTFILLLIVCLIYTTTMWLGILLVPEVFVNILMINQNWWPSHLVVFVFSSLEYSFLVYKLLANNIF